MAYLAPARRRGMGAAATSLAEWCDQAAWYNPIAYTVCLPHDVAKIGSDIASSVRGGFTPQMSAYPMPPAPVAPTTTLVSNGGVDVAGNPTYDVVTQTPQQNQASIVDQMRAFFTGVDAANHPASVPCSGVFSDFDSACNPNSSLMWLGAGVVGLGLFAAFVRKGRR